MEELDGSAEWQRRGTVKSRQGVVNTRQSGAFVVPILFFFTRFSGSNVGGSVSPQLDSPGAAASCGKCARVFLRALTDGGDCGGGSSGLPHLGPPPMAGVGGGYGVPLTRTNCLECEVRANTAGRLSSALWTLLVFLLVEVPVIFHCELSAWQKPSMASFKTRWLTLFKLELVLFINKKSWLNI